MAGILVTVEPTGVKFTINHNISFEHTLYEVPPEIFNVSMREFVSRVYY